MAFSTNLKLLTPIMRSLISAGPRASMLSSTKGASFSSLAKIPTSISAPLTLSQLYKVRHLSSGPRQTFSREPGQTHEDDQPQSLSKILETEIQEETAELNRNLTSDQFPGFSVETDGSEVKLTKQVGESTVVVRFTVSSSLSEWRTENNEEQRVAAPQDPESQEGYNFSLLSMPEFQVQIVRSGKTLEANCFFEDVDQEEGAEESGPLDPVFHVDEIVMYDGEPRETEFAVSTEYFREELQDGLFQYLAEHGIDEEFGKNLVSFATNYEKKQYIGLMKRLKDFISK